MRCFEKRFCKKKKNMKTKQRNLNINKIRDSLKLLSVGPLFPPKFAPVDVISKIYLGYN